MTASATRATKTPARTSSQKWFPVAMTENQTQSGQSAQTAFANQLGQTAKRTTPTISASAAWRLGIAAYGLAKKLTKPLPCLRLADCARGACEPERGDPRGGAAGCRSAPAR